MARNYYHVSFTNSTVCKGRDVPYFSFAPTLNYTRELLKTEKTRIFGGL
jgi:hypothetical protein